MNSLLKQKIDIKKENFDTIYLNLTLTNNQPTSQPANIIVNLPANFIPEGEIWDSGIDRFCLSGQSIPMLIWKDDFYYVTLSYNGVPISAPLLYNSVSDQGPNQLIPQGIFSYQQIALILNAALSTAFDQLQIAVAPALNATTAPFVVFNTTTQNYQLYADSAFYDETISTPVFIYYNSVLYYLFNNYLSQFIGENTVSRKDIRIAVRNMGANTNVQIIGGVTYDIMSQEYSNTGAINQVQLISIYSNTMGITPELTTASNTGPNLVNTDFSSGGIPITNLIADFSPNFGNADPAQIRSIITYLPAYRRLHNRNLVNSSNTADIQVYWSNAQSVQFPFYIEPNSAMTIKFAFLKRKF